MTKDELLDKVLTLGGKAQKAGDLAKAREMYQKVINISPDSQQAQTAQEHLRALATLPARKARATINRIQGQVVITDIHIPFFSIVEFMMKWVFATVLVASAIAIMGGLVYHFGGIIIAGIGR